MDWPSRLRIGRYGVEPGRLGPIIEPWVGPPGERREDFTHRADELVLVLEGAMEFEVEGRASPPRSAKRC